MKRKCVSHRSLRETAEVLLRDNEPGFDESISLLLLRLTADTEPGQLSHISFTCGLINRDRLKAQTRRVPLKLCDDKQHQHDLFQHVESPLSLFRAQYNPLFGDAAITLNVDFRCCFVVWVRAESERPTRRFTSRKLWSISVFIWPETHETLVSPRF